MACAKCLDWPDLHAGDEVLASPVMGKGFPVDRTPADSHPTVLLFATGSGISPIKALLESEALSGRDVALFYGWVGMGNTHLLPRPWCCLLWAGGCQAGEGACAALRATACSRARQAAG